MKWKNEHSVNCVFSQELCEAIVWILILIQSHYKLYWLFMLPVEYISCFTNWLYNEAVCKIKYTRNRARLIYILLMWKNFEKFYVLSYLLLISKVQTYLIYNNWILFKSAIYCSEFSWVGFWFLIATTWFCSKRIKPKGRRRKNAMNWYFENVLSSILINDLS